MSLSPVRIPLAHALGAEQSVSDYVLRTLCIGSFWECLEKGYANSKRNKIVRDKHSHAKRYTSYWAVAGRDTAQCPIRIYEEVRSPCTTLTSFQRFSAGRKHKKEHLSRLVTIVR